ncbi:acid proteinase [Pseudomassariella vexata]|uniref:Acid proteinase n=1 Tax=Pseudomassariella vexata TaxID=1141098 RepID=A0A1Y2EFF4_9PEZI|nr:acid proteinase [Pseudomassariella vexata]ORY70289.1 acid proteinase [Pseudomassariella vexata]
MKFTTVATALLCAESAFAARFTEQRRERHAKRAAARGERLTLPKIVAEQGEIEAAQFDNETQVSYSTNWAGAVLIGSGYKSVTGTIVVPTPSVPSGGSTRTEYAASAWVGIDGDTCQTAILQTGVDFYVEGSSIAFDAWYEWYPDYAYTFSGIPISAGNTITMTVTATSTKTGTAVIKNVSTGKSVTHTFTTQSAALCQTNAEWIVEDFSSGNSLVPFADFDSVTFTGASVTTSSGTGSVSGAEILDIQQSNKVLTSCSTSGSSTVICNYSG